MPAPSSSLTLLLLLDAFRPDYLRHTPYLRSLAQSGATGALRECFGFLPRAAYFGGLNAEQFGFTNMYCFDPENSVFSSARAVVTPAAPGTPESQEPLRRFVETKARERLPGFAKQYATAAQIPLACLPYFDLVEKRAPWDKRVGFESLFALLDQQGIAWLQSSWPETNRLPDPSDAGIVGHVLQSLRPEHRFAYVHLQELDGTGHAHGPNSSELQARLARTDDLCRQLIESARQNYAAVNLVLFGDHGMVNVTRTLDLTGVLADLKLRFGSDYAYFLDSTMVRLWFYHHRAEQIVREAFQSVSGGRLLSAADLKHFGIAGCDRRNGELIFLADPGVLLFPNFFQGDGTPIKGMHGYDPDCADNLGVFLLHRAGQTGLAGQQLGRVNPHQIFPLLKELIGLPHAAPVPTLASLATQAPKTVGRFTPQSDPAAEQTVQQHLDTIVAAVRQRVGPFEAVVLTGSFGRGEGGVYQDDSGRWRPVNDYDIFVVSPRDSSPELKPLSESLAKELGLDYLDLGWTDGQWGQWSPTVANYDLKYGSQVIAGDTQILDRLPNYAAADLPVYEAVKLLLNRTAGLLTGLRGEMLGGTALSADQHRYLSNQIAKAQMALGDSYLIHWGGYDASYRLRRERFAALAPGAGLSGDIASQVTQGYDFKLHPDYSIYADPLAVIRRLRTHLEAAVVTNINRLCHGVTSHDLPDAMQRYLATMSEDAGRVVADNAYFLSQPGFRNLLHAPAPTPVSLRHLVYSALPQLLATAFADGGAGESLEVSHRLLATHFQLPQSSGTHPEAWENLRGTTVAAWFAVHH